MKSSYLTSPGSSLTFGELPTPLLTDESVKIKVLYCGVNHLDVLIRQGKRPGILSYPHILGSEVIGIIDEIKSDTKKFTVGDTIAVYPWTFCGKCQQCQNGNEQICDTGGTFGRTSWGGYAQYLVAPIRNLIKIPSSLPVDEVCALILAGTTAMHLIERSGVKKNQTVLVTGATGGVGTIIIQLLKLLECTVIAVTSHREKSQKLKHLGVDHIISLISADVVADVVIDIVGGDMWSNALTTLVKNGTMVFCSTSRDEMGAVPISTAFSKQWNILGSYGGNRRHLKAIISKYQEGIVKPIIHSIHSLSDAIKTHEIIENQSVFGKILIRP